MKKVLMILFVGIISIGFISGCGKKTKEAITADQFNERIGSNYKLVDYTKNIGYAKKAYFYDSEGIYFYFYEGNRSFDMGNIYIDEVNNAANELFNKQDSIDKGDNYSSVTMYNDETYYRIAYVDNTLLYVRARKDYKDRADDIFNKCGY
jgi:hypothetical protein